MVAELIVDPSSLGRLADDFDRMARGFDQRIAELQKHIEPLAATARTSAWVARVSSELDQAIGHLKEHVTVMAAKEDEARLYARTFQEASQCGAEIISDGSWLEDSLKPLEGPKP